MRILLVDDTIEIREVLAEALRDDGHFVIEARDGHDGICKLSQSRDVDVIITDLQMPVWDGYKMAHEAKKISTAKIILHSASPNAKVTPDIDALVNKGDLQSIKKLLHDA